MIDMEEKKPVLHKPTQWERLGSFACSHFLFSIFGAMVLVGGGLIWLELEKRYGYEIFFALLMVASLLYLTIYMLLGRWAAGEKMWLAPASGKERISAFLFPALIAWIWGGLVLTASAMVGLAGYHLATALLWISFVLASPSFLMVFTAVAFGWLDGGLLNMILSVLVVGGLPPLLFLLGSIWGSRRAERGVVRAKEESEVQNGTEQRDATA